MPQEFKLKIGDTIPFFKLKDDLGRTFTSDESYGRPFVIYFYPKDDTEGCTAEACSFRDSLEQFDDIGVSVVGISPDSIESHQQFKKKYDLNFPLLADTDHSVCDAFDVWKEKSMYGKTYFGVIRSTFVVDSEGIIRWIERPVKVEGHIERVLNAMRDMERLYSEE